jgi:hypothetical protein
MLKEQKKKKSSRPAQQSHETFSSEDEPHYSQKKYLMHLKDLIIQHEWHLHGGGKTYYWYEKKSKDEDEQKEKAVPSHIYRIITRIDKAIEQDTASTKKNFKNSLSFIEKQIKAVLEDHEKKKNKWWYKIFGRSQDTVDFCEALNMPYDSFLFIEDYCKEWLTTVFIDNMKLAEDQAKVNGHTIFAHRGSGGDTKPRSYTISNAPRHINNIIEKIHEAQSYKITYYQSLQKVQKILEKDKKSDSDHWWSLRRPFMNMLYSTWLKRNNLFLEAIQGIKELLDNRNQDDSAFLITPRNVINFLEVEKKPDHKKEQQEEEKEMEKEIGGEEITEERKKNNRKQAYLFRANKKEGLCTVYSNEQEVNVQPDALFEEVQNLFDAQEPILYPIRSKNGLNENVTDKITESLNVFRKASVEEIKKLREKKEVKINAVEEKKGSADSFSIN